MTFASLYEENAASSLQDFDYRPLLNFYLCYLISPTPHSPSTERKSGAKLRVTLMHLGVLYTLPNSEWK